MTHVQHIRMRTLNGCHGVQQRSTNLESTLVEGDIGETVVQNVHLNQVTIEMFLPLIAIICNHGNIFSNE